MYGTSNLDQAQKSAEKLVDTAVNSRTASQVTEAAADLKDAAAAHAREMSDAAAQEARRFGEMAREWFTTNRRSAGDLASAAREHALDVSDRAQAYVRDEPVKSVMIAAAVGAVVAGLLMGNSRRRD